MVSTPPLDSLPVPRFHGDMLHGDMACAGMHVLAEAGAVWLAAPFSHE